MDPAQAPLPSRGHRWTRWTLIAATVVAAVLVWLRPSNSEMQAQLSALQALGYPTTLTGLESWFQPPSAAENLAVVVLEASEELRQPKGAKVPLIGSDAPIIGKGEPWPAETLRQTQDYVADNAAAFLPLPELITRRRGRFDVGYTNGFNIRFTHLMPLKRLAQALAVRAGLDAEEGRAHQAVQDILGIVAVARSLDEEPMFISLLVRIITEDIAIGATERLLNRVAVDAADLAALQETLLQRASVSSLDRSLVGELCLGLDGFARSPKELAAMSNAANNLGLGPSSPPATGVASWALYRISGLQQADQAHYVRMMARYIDIARQPPSDRFGPLDEWGAEVDRLTSNWLRGRVISAMALPSLAHGAVRDAEGIARLRCAGAALAVERHRAAHGGRLPESLNELVPVLLAAVPIDPFDGKPLRFRHRDAGYVVYSLGRDRDDDAGRERKKGGPDLDHDITFILER